MSDLPSSGPSGPYSSDAAAVNADGSVIVGTMSSVYATDVQAYRWHVGHHRSWHTRKGLLDRAGGQC
jgi:uncharacterized membrane protein